MESKSPKFPVQKPYIKVQNDYESSKSCSARKPPDLSYSYSCVKAFKDNQNIIGNLAALHEKCDFDSLFHQPALFSLSGERKSPIYLPFYCGSLSKSSKVENCDCNISDFQFKYQANPLHIQNDSEPDLTDKNILLEWLKYQFKYVNSLWPFIKAMHTSNPFSKLCRKSKEMRMEILLNNIDEKTKYKLKKYVDELNLNLEERHNLSNESVIEIDITPILADSNRLRNFLIFLKNLEISVSKEVEKTSVYSQNEGIIRKNYFTKHIVDGYSLLQHPTKKGSTTHAREKNGCPQNTYDQENSLKFKNPSAKYFISELNQTEPTRITYYNNNCCSPGNSATLFCYCPKKSEEILDSTKKGKNSKKIQNKHNFINNNRVLSPNSCNIFNNKISSSMVPLKKGKLKSTKEHNFNYGNALMKGDWLSQKENKHRKNIFYAQTNCSKVHNNNFIKNNSLIANDHLCRNNFSCNCLIHDVREDYNRYRNQCLFGKGDESSNSLIKYLAMQESISKSKLCSLGNQLNDTTLRFEKPKTGTKNVWDENSRKGKDKEIVVHLNQEKQTLMNQQPSVIDDKETFFGKESTHNGSKQKHTTNKKKLDIRKSSGFKYESEIRKFKKSKLNKKRSVIHNNVNSFQSRNENPNYKDDNSYHVVRIEDVEELICAVNYGGSRYSSSSFEDSSRLSSTQCKIDRPYNQLSLNACFESLNYSLNSFASNTHSDVSKCPSAELANSYPSGTISSYSTFSEVQSLINSNSTCDLIGPKQSKEINFSKLNTISWETLQFNKISKDEHPRIQKYSNSQRKIQPISVQMFNKEHNINLNQNCNEALDHPERNRGVMKNQLNYENTNSNSSLKFESQAIKKTDLDGKIQKQSHILTVNAREVEAKTLDLNQQASLLRNENINSFKSKGAESYKQKRKKMHIKTNSTDSRSTNNINIPTSDKKNCKLNLLKPNKIYKSISSIFKGNNVKDKVVNAKQICKNNILKKEIHFSRNECKCVTQKQEIDHSYMKFKIDNSLIDTFTDTHKSICCNKLEQGSPIVLAQLDKLFTELRCQREEIDCMKRLFQDHNT